MKKPQYASQLVGFIFLAIGGFFAVFAIAMAAGTAMASDSPAVLVFRILLLVFGAIGLLFLAAGAALRASARARIRRKEELLEQGHSVMGTVEDVIYVRSMRYFGRSPYCVWYRYPENGQNRRGKTELLWERPQVSPGEAIRVYTDHEGHSAVKLPAGV